MLKIPGPRSTIQRIDELIELRAEAFQAGGSENAPEDGPTPLQLVRTVLTVVWNPVNVSLSAFNWSRNSDELTNEFAAGFVGSNVGIF